MLLFAFPSLPSCDRSANDFFQYVPIISTYVIIAFIIHRPRVALGLSRAGSQQHFEVVNRPLPACSLLSFPCSPFTLLSLAIFIFSSSSPFSYFFFFIFYLLPCPLAFFSLFLFSFLFSSPSSPFPSLPSPRPSLSRPSYHRLFCSLRRL